MSNLRTIINRTSVAALAAAGLIAGSGAQAQPIGEGLVMYFQMGGNPGDGSTLGRTNGARAAAEAFGLDLREQYSGWQPDKMLDQFREASAANPDCIEIMGHPGNDAFADRVIEATEAGIVVTSGNAKLDDLFRDHRKSGFGFVGMDNYSSGALVASGTVRDANLQPGDRVMVYGLLSQDERGQLERGALDVFEEAGMTVDYIEISPEVNSDSSLAVPVIAAYVDRNPDVKAIITSHGNITGFLAKALQEAGKAPDDVFGAGYDIVPATVEGLKDGYVDIAFDQNLFLQGFMPVVQCVLSATYEIPGLHIDTGIGLVTPANLEAILPEIEAGLR